MIYRLQQNMRWHGPHDTVTLGDIKVSGIVTALRQIPWGESGPRLLSGNGKLRGLELGILHGLKK